MPTNSEHDFTPKERYYIQHFRSEAHASMCYALIWDGFILCLSLFCIWVFITQNERGFGVMGYGLLVWRIGYQTIGSIKSTDVLRSIIRKYESRIAELSDHAD